MKKDLMLSVIIPVYNEEKTIIDIIERVRSVNLPKEIIVVNDCSTDRTKGLLDNYPKNELIKVIHHNANLGKGSALSNSSPEIW